MLVPVRHSLCKWLRTPLLLPSPLPASVFFNSKSVLRRLVAFCLEIVTKNRSEYMKDATGSCCRGGSLPIVCAFLSVFLDFAS